MNQRIINFFLMGIISLFFVHCNPYENLKFDIFKKLAAVSPINNDIPLHDIHFEWNKSLKEVQFRLMKNSLAGEVLVDTLLHDAIDYHFKDSLDYLTTYYWKINIGQKELVTKFRTVDYIFAFAGTHTVQIVKQEYYPTSTEYYVSDFEIIPTAGGGAQLKEPISRLNVKVELDTTRLPQIIYGMLHNHSHSYVYTTLNMKTMKFETSYGWGGAVGTVESWTFNN